MSESTQPLTLKFRPRRFQDMVGQKPARVLLMQMLRTGNVPPALLLHGSHGSGKTSSARIVAASLNCEADIMEARPCGRCPTCQAIVDGKSSDVIEIDAASSGLAEDMRELRQQVRFHPISRYRAVILDEAHELSVKGQQTLLKVLEEPPPHVVFILATTNVDKVLDTIASRCFLVQFQRITAKDIAARLLFIAETEDLALSEELALAIAERSAGAMRDAVMLLQQCALVGVQTPEHLQMLMGDSDLPVRLVAALVAADYPTAFELAREGLETLPSPSELISRVVSVLRRVLVLSSLHSGAASAPLVPPATDAERAVAANLAPARAVAGMRMVWDYYRSVAPALDAYAAMDLVVVMLGQALSGAQAPTVKSKTHSIPTSVPNSSMGTASPAATVDDILASAAAFSPQ